MRAGYLIGMSCYRIIERPDPGEIAFSLYVHFSRLLTRPLAYFCHYSVTNRKKFLICDTYLHISGVSPVPFRSPRNHFVINLAVSPITI